MIRKIPEDTKTYKLDIGRPSFFSDEDCLVWRKFFEYVESTEIEIATSGIYHNMRDIAFNNGRYGGGGFQFCFWFNSKEARKEFAKEVGLIFKEKVSDFRNIMFFAIKNETTGNREIDSVRFTPQYLDKANEIAEQLFVKIEKHTHKDFFTCEMKETGWYHAKGKIADLKLFKNALEEHFFEFD